MKKSLLVLARGEFESQGSGRFVKEIAHVGKFLHPRTGQEIVFTKERIEKLAAANERYLKNGNKIPFPDGHSFKSVDNLGHWTGPFMRYQDKFVGVVEVPDAKAAEKLSKKTITGVSALIEFDVTDPKGEKYDEVCTHICATEYPVVTGQTPFIELASKDAAHDLYVSEELAGIVPEGKENLMDPKKLAAALGLDPEKATADQVLEAAAKAGQDLKVARESLSALSAELPKHGLKLDQGKVVKVEALASESLDLAVKPEDDPEKAALKKRLMETQLSSVKSQLEAGKQEAARLIKAGQIPAAHQKDLEELLSIQSEAPALALSSDGTALIRKTVRAGELVRKILGGLPSILKSGLQQLSTKPEEEVGGEKDAEALAAKGAEIARKALGKPAKKETAGAK